jgi:hypothetical protein
MGNSTWSSHSYETYAINTGYRTASIRDVFSNNVVEKLDPRNIVLRESVDSEANPNSTPIILGLDVTGSMGIYAHDIAVNHLPRLMNMILDSKIVTDPHLMFMGIDDIHCDICPLQVSQFEADIKIVEQLRDIYLVGGGGGNDSESYDLAWYFAANYTKIDSFDKRGEPGFIFTFGDEKAPVQNVSKRQFERNFNDSVEKRDMSPKEMLEGAQKRYQVFHVIIEQGNYCNSHLSDVHKSWTDMLGNNALFLRDSEYLTDVIMATLSIASGNDIQTVIDNSTCPSELIYAFKNALYNSWMRD